MSAWRCTRCSKLSNAKARPYRHVNVGGEWCGPFEAAQIAPPGAVLAPAGSVIAAPVVDSAPEPGLRYRQSTVRAFATGCPRATVLSSEHTTGTIGSSADLGSAFHATSAEIRRTLYRQNEAQISTEECVAIMREVVAAGPWVLSPIDYRGDGDRVGLVQMVCAFADQPWLPHRFMVIEGATRPFDGTGRLSTDIPCPDGELRTLTGAPDLVISDPPHGVVIVDDKTGLSKPPTPREPVPDGEPIRGAQYLAEGGYAQGIIYGVLVMAKWPAVQTVTWREKSWRWNGPPREATISRADLEHLLPYLGTVMMQLDQGLREGEGSEFARPRPGTHCNTRCAVAASCPVPQEQRGLGMLADEAAADEAAQRWVVIRALDKQLRAALKSFHEAPPHYAPRVNEGLVVRWRDKSDGRGRDFGAFPPVEPAPPADTSTTDDAFLSAMEAEPARRTVAA